LSLLIWIFLSSKLKKAGYGDDIQASDDQVDDWAGADHWIKKYYAINFALMIQINAATKTPAHHINEIFNLTSSASRFVPRF